MASYAGTFDGSPALSNLVGLNAIWRRDPAPDHEKWFMTTFTITVWYHDNGTAATAERSLLTLNSLGGWDRGVVLFSETASDDLVRLVMYDTLAGPVTVTNGMEAMHGLILGSLMTWVCKRALLLFFLKFGFCQTYV